MKSVIVFMMFTLSVVPAQAAGRTIRLTCGPLTTPSGFEFTDRHYSIELSVTDDILKKALLISSTGPSDPNPLRQPLKKISEGFGKSTWANSRRSPIPLEVEFATDGKFEHATLNAAGEDSSMAGANSGCK